MIKIWFKRLGLKTFIVITIGKIFHKILIALDYYDVHIPVRNEILELLERDFQIRMRNRFILASQPDGHQEYLIRPQTSDKLVLYQVIANNEYSPITDLIQLYKTQDGIKTIIDAGANIGLTSLYFKKYYPQARIVAVEPEVNNHLQLLKNIHLNKFSKSIIPINKALWKNNTDRLCISSDFRDGQYWAKTVIENFDPLNTIATITLSDLISQNFTDGPLDILKMDIEGSENVLFKDSGFIETLTTKVRFLCLEIHDEFNCRSFITQTLNDCNFSVKDIGETTFCVNKSLVNLLVNE